MKIPALNDSQYIGMNVYNVVIMSIIVVVLSNILSHQPTLAYVVESSFMLLSTTVTLCLLFVPKVSLWHIITFVLPSVLYTKMLIQLTTENNTHLKRQSRSTSFAMQARTYHIL